MPVKLLTRRGVVVEDMGQTYQAEPDTDSEEWRTLRPLQAAALGRHKQSTGVSVSGLSTTHLVMSPLEFMERLAGLVPRPTRQRPVMSDS